MTRNENDLKGTLKAIIERTRAGKDDRTDRLAYADWLDDFGDGGKDAARATFIRSQVEAAGLPEGSPRRAELEKQAEGILEQYRKEWEIQFRDLGATEVGFARGF